MGDPIIKPLNLLTMINYHSYNYRMLLVACLLIMGLASCASSTHTSEFGNNANNGSWCQND